jgi:bifunctional non-homologous end joining protein LigD
VIVQEEIIRIGGHTVKITRPGKILFPEDGITKQELIDYYRRIAPWILPHLRSRPVAMERYPDGINQPGFFHKAAPSYYPGWLKTVTIKRKMGGTVRHVVCDNAATLVYLANQACVTPHIWLSRTDKLEYPDQLVFDLDPSEENFEPVKATAQSLKELLDQLGLPVYLKTTGSRGLHVAVPLKRTEVFDSVRAFARELAEVVVSREPTQRTLEQRKSMRRGRVFLDTNRNAYAQTVAPAYAVRARHGAPVSVPLDWNELRRRDLRPDGVTIRNVFDRLEKVGDPWIDFWPRGASLTGARQKFKKLNATRRIPQEEEVH